MAHEHSQISLKDAVEFVVDNRGKTVPVCENGIPLIATNCVSNDDLYPKYTNVRYVSDEIYSKWFRAHPKPHDIILTNKGSKNGAICLVPDPVDFCIAQDMVALRADSSKIDPAYLFAALRSPQIQFQIQQLNVDSVIPHFKKTDFDKLFIPLPEKYNQAAIGQFYLAFSRKIELNRQMNATLEGMAQALFKSWFVDFDPVIDNAVAAGNPIPEELADRAEVRRAALADGTANREVAKPFPAGFQHTEELGWIPEGWEPVSINNAIEINPRVSLPKGTVATYADMKALPTSGYAIGEVASKAYVGGTKFQNNDVLLARITPCLENGKTGIVDFLANESDVGFGSTEFIVLRQQDEITFPYIACLARDEKFRLHCMQSMVGSSGRQRVQNACFDSFYVAIPTDSSVLGTFNRTTQPMFKKFSEGGFVSRNLTKLRDTLLPKLISGELRIPDAEKLAEEALA